MPRYEMKTTACGPDGNHYAGQTYDLPAAVGEPYVAGGHALRVSGPPPAPKVEAAIVDEAAERAVASHQRKAKKKRGRKSKARKVSGEG